MADTNFLLLPVSVAVLGTLQTLWKLHALQIRLQILHKTSEYHEFSFVCDFKEWSFSSDAHPAVPIPTKETKCPEEEFLFTVESGMKIHELHLWYNS